MTVRCVRDPFNRADASVLGNADTGELWALQSGTLGIESNKIAPKTYVGAGCWAITDHGGSDGTFTADVVDTGVIRAGGGFAFRAIDTSNYWHAYAIRPEFGLARLWLIRDGTLVDETITSVVDHTKLILHLDGPDITLIWSGGSSDDDLITYSDSTHMTETKHGPITSKNASGDPNPMDNYEGCVKLLYKPWTSGWMRS